MTRTNGLLSYGWDGTEDGNGISPCFFAFQEVDLDWPSLYFPEINTHHSIDGHVQQSSGPDNVEDSVNVLKDSLHHLILVLGSRPGGAEKER